MSKNGNRDDKINRLATGFVKPKSPPSPETVEDLMSHIHLNNTAERNEEERQKAQGATSKRTVRPPQSPNDERQTRRRSQNEYSDEHSQSDRNSPYLDEDGTHTRTIQEKDRQIDRYKNQAEYYKRQSIEATRNLHRTSNRYNHTGKTDDYNRMRDGDTLTHLKDVRSTQKLRRDFLKLNKTSMEIYAAERRYETQEHKEKRESLEYELWDAEEDLKNNDEKIRGIENIQRQWTPTLIHPHYCPHDVEIDTRDLKSAVPTCTGSTGDVTFKEMFTKLTLYGQQKRFSENNYRQAMGILLQGEAYALYQKSMHLSTDEIITTFKTMYVSGDTSSDSQEEAKTFERKSNESLRAAMTRYKLILMRLHNSRDPRQNDERNNIKCEQALLILCSRTARIKLEKMELESLQYGTSYTWEDMLNAAEAEERLNNDRPTQRQTLQVNVSNILTESKLDNVTKGYNQNRDQKPTHLVGQRQFHGSKDYRRNSSRDNRDYNTREQSREDNRRSSRRNYDKQIQDRRQRSSSRNEDRNTKNDSYNDNTRNPRNNGEERQYYNNRQQSNERYNNYNSRRPYSQERNDNNNQYNRNNYDRNRDYRQRSQSRDNNQRSYSRDSGYGGRSYSNERRNNDYNQQYRNNSQNRTYGRDQTPYRYNNNYRGNNNYYNGQNQQYRSGTQTYITRRDRSDSRNQREKRQPVQEINMIVNAMQDEERQGPQTRGRSRERSFHCKVCDRSDKHDRMECAETLWNTQNNRHLNT